MRAGAAVRGDDALDIGPRAFRHLAFARLLG